MNRLILEVTDLTITLPGNQHLVEKLSFSIYLRETLALVGRSGSGKSLTAQAILGLFQSPEVQIKAGTILLCGEDITHLRPPIRRLLLGRKMALIPQNPQNALNPTRTIGSQLMEAALIIGVTKNQARDRALFLLNRVGITETGRYFQAIPSQLSGGMRQRVLIAMALMNNPPLIIADEPTTALDVTVQAQILDLLESIQEEFGISLLFITHDLGVVARIAHRAVILDRGKKVEECDISSLFTAPNSEAGKSLIEAAQYCYGGYALP